MLIQGHLRLVDHQLPADSGMRKSIQAANEAAERIGKIASRTLDFTRHGGAAEEQARVDRIIDDAYSFVRPYLDLRRISFEFEPGHDLATFRVDRMPLVQVLVNLFQNAADAMTDRFERRLTVETRLNTHRLTLRVTDTGRGIPTADTARIFEPFFTTKGQLGTGLGLYITRRIVIDELHGAISADSVPGNTTFTLSLPRL